MNSILKGEVVLFTSSQLVLMFFDEDVLGCISLMKWSYEVYSIGYQILIKSETFALKQDLQYPPGGGGGGHVIIGIWEKKIWIIGI